jgi:hypothetical protein
VPPVTTASFPSRFQRPAMLSSRKNATKQRSGAKAGKTQGEPAQKPHLAFSALSRQPRKHDVLRCRIRLFRSGCVPGHRSRRAWGFRVCAVESPSRSLLIIIVHASPPTQAGCASSNHTQCYS